MVCKRKIERELTDKVEVEDREYCQELSKERWPGNRAQKHEGIAELDE